MTAVPNAVRLAGREYDAETQLYYNRAPYYDPAVGRFISEDPAGLGAGNNLYAYAGNDPINRPDPSGLCNGSGGTTSGGDPERKRPGKQRSSGVACVAHAGMQMTLLGLDRQAAGCPVSTGAIAAASSLPRTMGDQPQS